MDGRVHVLGRRAERDPRGRARCPRPATLVSDLFAVVRWLEYLCFALLGGAVAFLIICWPDGGKRRGVRRLVTASSLGLLVSTLLGLLLQGPYGAGAGLGQLLSGTLMRQTMDGSLGPLRRRAS